MGCSGAYGGGIGGWVVLWPASRSLGVVRGGISLVIRLGGCVANSVAKRNIRGYLVVT